MSFPSCQIIYGSCLCSHGCPNTTGLQGDLQKAESLLSEISQAEENGIGAVSNEEDSHW